MQVHKHLKKFTEFINQFGLTKLNDKLKSFNNDVRFVFSMIAEHYCPRAIAIIQFTEANSGFKKLFKFLDDVVEPSKKTIDRTMEKQLKFEQFHEQFVEKMKNLKESNKKKKNAKEV